MKCECCNTNKRKSYNAKYCEQCSAYICGILLYRMHRVDARYKKIWKNMFEKLQKLSEEDPFVSRQLIEMIDAEGFDIDKFRKKGPKPILADEETGAADPIEGADDAR